MTSTAARIQVKCLDHVTLVVADLERSRQFYVGVLGMEEVERPGFSFAGCWFQAGGTQIHLILEHAESGPAGIFVPPHHASSRTHHFAFEVDDAYEADGRAGGADRFATQAASRRRRAGVCHRSGRAGRMSHWLRIASARIVRRAP
ncbi:MAG: VOC family protein [Planctomycetaceae bacterium]